MLTAITPQRVTLPATAAPRHRLRLAADDDAVDDPTLDEPTLDEPFADDPTIDEPTLDEPIVDEPPARRKSVDPRAA